MASRTMPALVALLLATTACTGGSDVAGRGDRARCEPLGRHSWRRALRDGRARPGRPARLRRVGPVLLQPPEPRLRLRRRHPRHGGADRDRVAALVGASGVRIVDAWVMPVRGVPPRATGAVAPAAHGPRRQGRVGGTSGNRPRARPGPGTTYNLIVRMRRPGPRTPGGFKALAIEYRTPSTSYARDTHTRGRFKRSCSDQSARSTTTGAWSPAPCRPLVGRSRPPSRVRRGREPRMLPILGMPLFRSKRCR